MPFTEAIKIEAKRKSHFQCCICKQPFVEVHHIQPQADGGSDELDNAAPLCAGCHDLFGGNPEKRKQISQMRDLWWELCEQHVQRGADSSIYKALDYLKSELDEAKQTQEAVLAQMKDVFMQAQEQQKESILKTSNITEFAKAVGSLGFSPEISTCPKCGSSVYPVGPKVGADGLVMFYRCSKCDSLFPGFEEWNG